MKAFYLPILLYIPEKAVINFDIGILTVQASKYINFILHKKSKKKTEYRRNTETIPSKEIHFVAWMITIFNLCCTETSTHSTYTLPSFKCTSHDGTTSTTDNAVLTIREPWFKCPNMLMWMKYLNGVDNEKCSIKAM